MPSLRVALLVLVCLAGTLTAQGVDPSRLMSDLETLASDAMEGRQFGTSGGAKARGFVAERFRASGIRPFGDSYLHVVPASNRGAGANVLGFVPGAVRADRYLVISAHYDHIGTRNGIVFNGADDNASGTAALFAIAAQFKTRQPRNSLLFAAFDGEEIGMLGSKAFLRSPPVPVSALTMDVNIDMIGRDLSNRLFVVGTNRQPYLKPFLDRVTPVPPVSLVFGHDDPRRSDDWTRDSDHWTFIQAGIPAIYLGVEDYAHHHKSTDDAATIAPEFYAGAVETVIRVVQRLDADLDAILAARAGPRR